MKEPRSIIFVIVITKNDISNQIILKLAQEANPRGIKTIRIITKPNTLIKNSSNKASFFLY